MVEKALPLAFAGMTPVGFLKGFTNFGVNTIRICARSKTDKDMDI
jgi:hypothetical protein